MNTIQHTVIEEGVRSSSTGHPTENIWLWIALAELAIIFVLVVLLNRKNKERNLLKLKFKSNALQQDINMTDVMGNIFQARQLYDQLKRRCHPDRFTVPELRDKADAMFQQITENKRNYARLQKLKTQAEQELNIHF